MQGGIAKIPRPGEKNLEIPPPCPANPDPLPHRRAKRGENFLGFLRIEGDEYIISLDPPTPAPTPVSDP